MDAEASLSALQVFEGDSSAEDNRSAVTTTVPPPRSSSEGSDNCSIDTSECSTTIRDPLMVLLGAAELFYESREVDVIELPVGRPKAVRRLHDHNHIKLAKKLADECRMVLTLRGYTLANDLVVEQWLKNALRQVPNRRNAHCLKIISIAKVLVFTPTEYEVESSVLINSRAFMRRRFEMEQTKHSRLGGLYGWFTGYKRLEEPTGSS